MPLSANEEKTVKVAKLIEAGYKYLHEIENLRPFRKRSNDRKVERFGMYPMELRMGVESICGSSEGLPPEPFGRDGSQ